MIRMSEEYIYNHWVGEKSIKLRGKTWRVGKMSYGDYFLEQKKDWNRKETGNHSSDTLWLEKEIKNGRWNKNYIV